VFVGSDLLVISAETPIVVPGLQEAIDIAKGSPVAEAQAGAAAFRRKSHQRLRFIDQRQIIN
jgi:hypothetical protein